LFLNNEREQFRRNSLGRRGSGMTRSPSEVNYILRPLPEE